MQDSKTLSSTKREELVKIIKKNAIFGYGWAYPHEIDRINIHNASLLAMQRAFMHCIQALQSSNISYASTLTPSLPLQQTCPAETAALQSIESVHSETVTHSVLVDGKFCPDIPSPAEAIVKGDSKIPEIMAASILAKVARDAYMQLVHEVHPSYSIQQNKGYPTQQHKLAIIRHGHSPIHRYSFKIRVNTSSN